MMVVPALHIRLEGLTSSFRHPLTISGTRISTPMPSYSTLLGMISACVGRVVKPAETRIGFEFHCKSHDIELERTMRWSMDKKGCLKPHPKGQGISRRQVYWSPKLDLYLTKLKFQRAFKNPVATPCFGRSQDIAWIVFSRQIKLCPVPKGSLGPTLIPTPQPSVPGLVVRLPEWMDNTTMGYTREPGPFGVYQAMIPTVDLRFDIKMKHLYHPSDEKENNHVIYLHKWLEG